MAVLSLHPYHLPLSQPYRWAKGVQTHRTGFIARMALDGATGLGEAALLPHVLHDPAAFVRQAEALLEGLDPLAPDWLDQLALRECPPAIRCALSSALFSWQAARQGLRLAELFAGGDMVEEAVPVNALVTDATPAACVAATAEHVGNGIQTIKLKCGHDRDADLRRVAAIRDAFPDIAIRIDPNQSWDLAWAAEHLRQLRPFGLQYCEEPLAPGTPMAAYRRLREEGEVPIALDESITDPAAAELALTQGAADAFVLKLQRLGGLDRLLAVARLGRAHGVPSVVTSTMETTVGITVGLHAAALVQTPGLDSGLATSSFFADNLAEPAEVFDGCLRLPPGAGLGIALA